MSDFLIAARRVQRAWNDEGPAPEMTEEEKRRLWNNWPTMADALSQFATAEVPRRIAPVPEIPAPVAVERAAVTIPVTYLDGSAGTYTAFVPIPQVSEARPVTTFSAQHARVLVTLLDGIDADDPEHAHGQMEDLLVQAMPPEVRRAVARLRARASWWGCA